MKTLAFLLTAVTALAASTSPAVTVRLIDNAGVPLDTFGPATGFAGQMFRHIGVEIKWETGRQSRNAARHDIQIEFRRQTPAELLPGALAYALPYEGTHIVVFYDRVERRQAPRNVLAHVIAHEIGHILQGVAQHAGDGVMKASWSAEDYGRMRIRPLEFTEDDVALIRQGMAARSATMVAINER